MIPYKFPLLTLVAALQLSEAFAAPILPPAPRPGSTEDRRDFAELLRRQSTRTPEQCARAATEVEVSLASFFGPPYGPLSTAETRRLSGFFERTRAEADAVIQRLKKESKRPRPYQADPRVVPCVRREVTGAYPSGHAALAVVFGRMLSELFPERRAAIERRALEIGDDRVLAGVHHPTDIAAGRRLGEELVAGLRAQAWFRAGLERAQIQSRNIEASH